MFQSKAKLGIEIFPTNFDATTLPSSRLQRSRSLRCEKHSTHLFPSALNAKKSTIMHNMPQ
ncbi:hypothetical protein DWZ46_13120 [Faecalibacterium prausnitzii]|uniref:Uncharacterized protein n=1 Tax=Faecalibacterium prausnitzii TaxID=853 RepID=A0A3E2TY28_9FIRM|nr:hypothetical protein DWZ46_13120 [Faecalibacterium prausnitzii]